MNAIFIFSVVRRQTGQNRLKYPLPELQSVNRITNFPIVESGWNFAENFYNRVKVSTKTNLIK